MFIVTGLSLLLLVYVALGEGKRTYEQLEIEKLISQGRNLQSTIETSLRAGLPLKQFAGFKTLAENVVNGFDEIDAMVVYDQDGQQVFILVDQKNPQLPAPSALIKNIKQKKAGDASLDQDELHTQVVLPLSTRFETVGSLVVVASRAGLANRLNNEFRPLLIVVLVLSALFAVIVALLSPYLALTRVPWLQIGYVFTFLVMAGFVVATLVSLYTEGVQGKLQASASTLAQRLSDVVQFKLRFRDIDGLDRVFAEYQKSNPEISEANLVIDDLIQISTNTKRINQRVIHDPRYFEYNINLAGSDKSRNAKLIVTAPTSVVYNQVERSIRNFAALFVASAFLASLFLQVANSMQRLRKPDGPAESSENERAEGEAALIVVKPIFFLAVFLEHLLYSFLPKYMQEIATTSGVSIVYAAAPFTAYYLCFALSLIPAGRFAEKRGPRGLIWGGLVLASGGILGLILPLDISLITVLRGLSGIGQGMVFIGIQAYILTVASAEKKTQGAAIIVFGFQGGMISGMAIGSLLVSYLQPYGVFLVSATIGSVAAAYCLMSVPRLVVRPELRGSSADFGIIKGLRHVLLNGEFLQTMLCVGIPAKAILTGGITFAMPLLLGQRGYHPEEIGQIIMIYAMSVVVSSTIVSRLVDKIGNTTAILFLGAVLSGGGLMLLGLVGSPLVASGTADAAAVIVGVVLVGIAHGFINAPVVTHVAHSELAKEIGANTVTTTYRFIERIGHVAGPALFAQLFFIWGQGPQIFMGLGIAVIALGFLFLLRIAHPRAGRFETEVAR